jgi:hypothetical protein
MPTACANAFPKNINWVLKIGKIGKLGFKYMC